MNNNLIHYSTHIAMLKKLIGHKPISEEEYTLLKKEFLKDYKIVSDISTWISIYDATKEMQGVDCWVIYWRN